MIIAALHWFGNWVVGWGGILALVSLGAWALWYFTPGFLLQSKTAILHVAITATGITLASTYLSAHYFEKGYAEAVRQVAAADAAAIDRVNEGKKDLDACRAAHGLWNVTDGSCDK